MAEIHAFIESLPKGYQTEVGERGVGLSGGQRERIAIARALLKRPQVLIFDEATSALNPNTAEQLACTINGLKGAVTLIFIAHQLPKALQLDAVVRIAANPTIVRQQAESQDGNGIVGLASPHVRCTRPALAASKAWVREVLEWPQRTSKIGLANREDSQSISAHHYNTHVDEATHFEYDEPMGPTFLSTPLLASAAVVRGTHEPSLCS